MNDKIAILIVTAKIPPRMDGRDPLLAIIDGQDLLSQVTARACATGVPVFVTIATDTMDRAQAIASQPVTIIPLPDGKFDMAESLRAGIKSLPKGLDGVLVMLADMPKLTTDDLVTLLTHFAEVGAKRVISATDQSGRPGHPIVLPARLFRLASRMSGDVGARVMLQNSSVSLVRLDKGHAVLDLERPEDWIAWRTGTPPAKPG